MNKLELEKFMGDLPITRTRDWYGGDWRCEWAVHARERVAPRELAVVSVQFSVPRDPRYPVKVKASPRTCELIDTPLERRPTVWEAA